MYKIYSVKLLSRNYPGLCVSVIFGFIAIAYYWYILLALKVPTDIQYHVNYVTNDMCIQNKSAPAHLGFYYTVWFLSGFSCDYTYAMKVAVVLIGSLWGLTVYISAYLGNVLIENEENEFKVKNNILSRYAYIIAAVASCLIYPIPAFKYYFFVGLLPPNVYSNSTWICGLPFSIMAFGLGVRQLKADVKAMRTDVYISIVLMISVLFKPSFSFIFIPSYALLRVSQVCWRKWHLLLIPLSVALLPSLVLIAGQTVWIIANPQTLLGGKTSFAFSFPAGWRYTLPNLPVRHVLLRFACSFALPIFVYTIRPKWLKIISHQFAILCTVIGFLIFMIVHETGVRSLHANFIWQVIYGNHLLYWVIVVASLKWVPLSKKEYRSYLMVWSMIGIHVISGIVYLIAIAVRDTYY